MQPKIRHARLELDNGVVIEIDAIAPVSAGPLVELLMGSSPETGEQQDTGDENDYEAESRTPIDFGDALSHIRAGVEHLNSNPVHVKAHRFSESPAHSLDKGKLGTSDVHLVGRCTR